MASSVPGREIRSVSSLAFGVALIALGLTVVVRELTPLGFGQAAPVAALVGGIAVLAAVSGRARPPAGSYGDGGGGDRGAEIDDLDLGPW